MDLPSPSTLQFLVGYSIDLLYPSTLQFLVGCSIDLLSPSTLQFRVGCSIDLMSIESGDSSVVTRWTVDQEVVGSNPTHGGNLISVVRSLSEFTKLIR